MHRPREVSTQAADHNGPSPGSRGVEVRRGPRQHTTAAPDRSRQHTQTSQSRPHDIHLEDENRPALLWNIGANRDNREFRYGLHTPRPPRNRNLGRVGRRPACLGGLGKTALCAARRSPANGSLRGGCSHWPPGLRLPTRSDFAEWRPKPHSVPTAEGPNRSPRGTGPGGHPGNRR